MADDAAALALRTSQLRQMKEWEKEGLISAKKFSKAQDAILSAHLCLPESAFQDTPEQVPTSHSRNSTGGVRGPNKRLLSEEDSDLEKDGFKDGKDDLSSRNQQSHRAQREPTSKTRSVHGSDSTAAVKRNKRRADVDEKLKSIPGSNRS